MVKYKFSREINKEFSSVLRKRVRAYFKENQICQNGNSQMWSKSAFAFGIYLGPLLIILTAGISSIPILFALWLLMGLGKAVIGTSVMHDALHGSYSNKSRVNHFMGFSALVIGVDALIWKIQHNVMHHTFTNIEHADGDIAPSFILRFSPHQPKYWFHRYQHFYVVVLYSISTIVWVTFKDFGKIVQFKNQGLIEEGAFFKKSLLELILKKSFYHLIFLVLPILLLPIPAWLTILMFLSMHLVTGLLLSLVFQTAHVMPDCHFIMQEEEMIEENWCVHQLFTTTNYAMKNSVFSWMFGGLNYQIEHHLFPNICHVHYPKISCIVRETSEEFDIPYHSLNSFRSAIYSHFQMLKHLGQRA